MEVLHCAVRLSQHQVICNKYFCNLIGHTDQKKYFQPSIRIPEMHQETILSGPYLVDDAKFKAKLLQSLAKEAIGIEMEEVAYLQQPIKPKLN